MRGRSGFIATVPLDGWVSPLPTQAGMTKRNHSMKEINVEKIAKACHEVNRAYCLALGDNSQPAWDDAPAWQKDSAVLGVKLHANNPDAGPQASHESWMAQKLAEGWEYGPTKDPEAKKHPCIVPFDELPVAQQAKDFIFRAVVHSMI